MLPAGRSKPGAHRTAPPGLGASDTRTGGSLVPRSPPAIEGEPRWGSGHQTTVRWTRLLKENRAGVRRTRRACVGYSSWSVPRSGRQCLPLCLAFKLALCLTRELNPGRVSHCYSWRTPLGFGAPDDQALDMSLGRCCALVGQRLPLCFACNVALRLTRELNPGRVFHCYSWGTPLGFGAPDDQALDMSLGRCRALVGQRLPLCFACNLPLRLTRELNPGRVLHE